MEGWGVDKESNGGDRVGEIEKSGDVKGGGYCGGRVVEEV